MKHLSWGFADQGLSSVSNVLLIFAVARVSSIHEFGVFSLCVAVLTTVTATCRGLLGTPLALLAGHDSRLARESSYAVVVASAIGTLTVPVLLVLGFALHSLSITVPLAVACPIVLAQDSARFVASSQGRPWLAVLSDGWWTVGSLALFGLSQTHLVTRPEALIWWWTGTALVALLLAAITTRTRPRVDGIGAWWRHDLRTRSGFGGEALIGATSGLLVLASAAAFVGTAASAALRGASSTLGPIAIVFHSIPIAVVPDIRRRGLESSSDIWRYMRRIAVPLSALSLAIGVVSLFVPEAVGFTFLGRSWTVIQPLLPITATEYAFLAWLNALNGGMRAQGRSAELLRVRIFFAGGSLVLGCSAAAVFGSASAVSWSLVGAAALATAYSRTRLFHAGLAPVH